MEMEVSTFAHDILGLSTSPSPPSGTRPLLGPPLAEDSLIMFVRYLYKPTFTGRNISATQTMINLNLTLKCTIPRPPRGTTANIEESD